MQVEIPTDMRLVMLGAMLGIFAAFTVAGLFSSLVPSFLRGILGVNNLAVVGAASFFLFATAAATQALSASMPSRRSVSLGLPLLLAGIGALEGSLFAAALWLFLVGTVVSGVAYGLVFRGGLSEIGRLADPTHRAQVMSAFFVAAYLGLGLPVVLIGLMSQLIGTVDASAYVAGLLAVVIVAATVVVVRTFGEGDASRPSDRGRRMVPATQYPNFQWRWSGHGPGGRRLVDTVRSTCGLPFHSAIGLSRAVASLSRMLVRRCSRPCKRRQVVEAHFQLDNSGGADMASSAGTSGPSSENTDGAAPGAPSGGTALLATLAMAQFMVVLDFTIVNVALPSIQHGLQVAHDDAAVVGERLRRHLRRLPPPRRPAGRCVRPGQAVPHRTLHLRPSQHLRRAGR